LFRINQETGPAIDLFRHAPLADAEMNVRRHTSDAPLSRWSIKNEGIKRARKVSLLWRRKWWCRTKPYTPQERFHRFELILMYLASAFSPEAGAFFVRSNVGGDPGLRQMSFLKRNLYAAQVSIGSTPMATKGHHVGNIDKEP
jgi:hypothetical protein